MRRIGRVAVGTDGGVRLPIGIIGIGDMRLPDEFIAVFILQGTVPQRFVTASVVWRTAVGADDNIISIAERFFAAYT